MSTTPQAAACPSSQLPRETLSHRETFSSREGGGFLENFGNQALASHVHGFACGKSTDRSLFVDSCPSVPVHVFDCLLACFGELCEMTSSGVRMNWHRARGLTDIHIHGWWWHGELRWQGLL